MIKLISKGICRTIFLKRRRPREEGWIALSHCLKHTYKPKLVCKNARRMGEVIVTSQALMLESSPAILPASEKGDEETGSKIASPALLNTEASSISASRFCICPHKCPECIFSTTCPFFQPATIDFILKHTHTHTHNPSLTKPTKC